MMSQFFAVAGELASFSLSLPLFVSFIRRVYTLLIKQTSLTLHTSSSCVPLLDLSSPLSSFFNLATSG